MNYKLDIVFVVPGMAFSGGSLTRHSLGGSETAAIELAKELQARGHNLQVFCDCTQPHTGGPGLYDEVLYSDLRMAQGWLNSNEYDVLVVQRNPATFASGKLRSKLNVLWNHDLAVKSMRPRLHSVLWNLDYITGLSKFHVEQQKEVLKVPEEILWQTRNGVNFDLIDRAEGNYNPKQIVYSSRPERGLGNLVKPGGIMEKLQKLDPDIKLIVAGYDHTTEPMRQYYEYLWRRVTELPNCQHVGALQKHRLYKLFHESGVYVYPSDFEEISFITAMECMRSGTPIIATDCGATKETVGDCAVLLDGPAKTEEYHDKFIGELLDLVSNAQRRESLANAGFDRSQSMSWAGVAEEWEEKFLSFFEEQSSNSTRLAKHFVYYGDLAVANEMLGVDLPTECQKLLAPQTGLSAAMDKEFIDSGFKVESMEQAMEYANPIVVKYAETIIKADHNAKRVVDLGCDFGAYTFTLAKMFPDKEFLGIDISPEKIAAARRVNTLPNVSFEVGTQRTVSIRLADVVLLFELLEYQEEPWEFIDELESFVREGARIAISTTFGPWGEVREGRIPSLWNFDRHDIREMFSKKASNLVLTASTGMSSSKGDILNLFCVNYTKRKDRPTGEIDFGRKVFIQRPRHTVSLCMIVKDSEEMLHRALKSTVNLVDEIIIVDTGSTDSTKEIAKQYTDKVFDGSDPLKYGFETPRNEALEKAASDWVLWIDSDEALLRGGALRKYLRDNVYNGYNIRQHHFSAYPKNILEDDLPVRLFRTDRGGKFYGVVHEHVEIAINESMKSTYILQDVDIAHDGYLTEAIRRARFDRNYKLMLRDREKYPNRRLGKFLMLRDDLLAIRYKLEEGKGGITEEMVKKCEEVIKTVREEFLGTEDHIQMKALEYYSEALKFIGRGFAVTWNIAVAKDKPLFKWGDVITSQFETAEDLATFLGSKFNNMCEAFEGKYSV